MNRPPVRVVLRERRVFFNDDLVEGVVIVDANEPLTANRLSLVFSGLLQFQWQQGRVRVEGRADLGGCALELFSSREKVQLNPGETVFPFSFKLPEVMVPSALFTDFGDELFSPTDLGSVRYTLSAILDSNLALSVVVPIPIGGLRAHYDAGSKIFRKVEVTLGQQSELFAVVPSAVVMGSDLVVRFEGPILPLKVACFATTRIEFSDSWRRQHKVTRPLGLVEVADGLATWLVVKKCFWPTVLHSTVKQTCTLQFRCEKLSQEIDVFVWRGHHSVSSKSPLEIPHPSFPSFYGATDAVPQEPQRAILWEPDGDRLNCALCVQAFGYFFHWKHHCRWCGRVVCDRYTSWMRLSCLGQKQQRICKKCTAESAFLQSIT